MKLEDLFDEKGWCEGLGNPYFRDSLDVQKTIFYMDYDDVNGHGNVRDNVYAWLVNFVKKTKTVEPMSDAVRIIMAQQMGLSTKGSYPAIYMWRKL